MNEEQKESLRLDRQLCFPLYAAARKITNLYTPYLKPLGITYTQYIVFLVLWENDGITVGELGRRLYLDNGTLTPLLKKMETAGYITRTRSREDERVVVICLTGAGRQMYEKCSDIPKCIGSCITLSEAEAQTLYQVLYKILLTEDEI
ncbi:MAG: MarR family transcriptional regulator [Solobacterium sp.]|nr:MarR family transcriptional regulator [Solobacterium sp.]